MKELIFKNLKFALDGLKNNDKSYISLLYISKSTLCPQQLVLWFNKESVFFEQIEKCQKYTDVYKWQSLKETLQDLK